jgi:two-component system NtrC family response regulator/two-component system response regulator HydG
MERAVVLADVPILQPNHFPTLRRQAADASGSPEARSTGVAIPGSTLEQIEREAILRTLESVGGSTSRAAAVLNISPRKIQYKMKEYHQQGSLVERP